MRIEEYSAEDLFGRMVFLAEPIEESAVRISAVRKRISQTY